MDTKWLDSFRGQHVTVFTIAGSDERSDTGTLAQLDSGWLQLVKDNGEMILIPSTAIRIVKLLNMTQTVPALERDPLAGLSTHIYEPNAQTI
jgi:hypothetical protein